MEHGQTIILVLITCILFLLVSCVKTQDFLITAQEDCKSKENLNNPDEYRDEYDNCLLFTDDELKTSEGCQKRCEIHCREEAMLYSGHWTDFSGCRCTCKLKLESH